jgi:acetyl-CoA carboxylase alpha subunit
MTATLGRTFTRDADRANAFSKLSRYETAIRQSLYKALHELQRLQAARHTERHVPPPIVLDGADVSGVSGEGV